MSNQRYSAEDLPITVNGHTYSVNVVAYGTYTHIPGRKYMRNGDPGYPDEDDFEIDEVNATWTDENGNVVEETEEMYDVLEECLYEDDGWEDDYPEPPDDYYEDQAMERWERQLDRAGL